MYDHLISVSAFALFVMALFASTSFPQNFIYISTREPDAASSILTCSDTGRVQSLYNWHSLTPIKGRYRFFAD